MRAPVYTGRELTHSRREPAMREVVAQTSGRKSMKRASYPVIESECRAP